MSTFFKITFPDLFRWHGDLRGSCTSSVVAGCSIIKCSKRTRHKRHGLLHLALEITHVTSDTFYSLLESHKPV